MSIGFVQGVESFADVDGSNNVAITIAATGASNAVVVCMFWKGAGSVDISSVTDDKGSTYADCGAGKLTRPVDGFMRMYGSPLVASGMTVVTVHFNSTPTVSDNAFNIAEYSGQDSATLFDSVTATGTATSVATVTTANLTPTVTAGAIVAIAYTSDNNGTAGTNFTARTANAGTGDILEDWIFSSSVGTVTASATMSINFARGGIIAAVLRQAPPAVFVPHQTYMVGILTQ
jgi:hypothetical protein